MSPGYLLIHGAWHGGWCWDKVMLRLQQAGQRVSAPTLTGQTLEGWVSQVCELIAMQPQPVVLVGHSRGGIVISRAAERLPDKIKTLVYLNAFLLRAGESVLRVLKEEGNSPLLRCATLSADKSTWVPDEREIRGMFYNECSDEDASFAQRRLVAEPAAPMMTPIAISEENFGRVPRVYIEGLRDRAIPLSLQRKMHAASEGNRVHSLDADHSPFFSAPEALTAQLLAL